MPAPVVYRTELTGLARIHEGKVRAPAGAMELIERVKS